MTIRQISEELWPDIMRIQREAYDNIEPESLEVMRSKWLHSPEFCFVHRESGGHVGAYLLGCAWTGMRLTGAGIGRQLVQCVLERATADGLRAALLVSIQGSAGFWAFGPVAAALMRPMATHNSCLRTCAEATSPAPAPDTAGNAQAPSGQTINSIGTPRAMTMTSTGSPMRQ